MTYFMDNLLQVPACLG